MEPSPQPPRRSHHRWLQLGLTSLLLVTLLAAALLAWQRGRISGWVESFWTVPAEAIEDDFNPWPKVMIQVMIAEVAVDGVRQSSAKLGFENSVLFDTPGAVRPPPSEQGSIAQGLDSVVLSADRDQVIAELRKRHRLNVLSRPQILAMTNHRVSVEAGQRTSSVQQAAVGLQTSRPGVVLTVTPNVTDDGRVAMEIDVQHSEAGPETERIPTAQASVSASSGQTVLLGGVFTKNASAQRSELVILLTPRVIWNEHDGEETK